MSARLRYSTAGSIRRVRHTLGTGVMETFFSIPKENFLIRQEWMTRDEPMIDNVASIGRTDRHRRR